MVLFGIKGNVKSDRGGRSGVQYKALLHTGQSTDSCQPPQPRWRREKNHFKMQVAQNVCPQ